MTTENKSNIEMSELSLAVQQELYQLFDFYHNSYKPVMALAETLKQEFPGPVLNEMRNLADHVASCFRYNATEQICLNELKRARRHIARAIIDCYKIMIICYGDIVVDFYKQYKSVNLALVNDGEFLPELTRLKDIAIKKTIYAKKIESESFSERESSYSAYMEAILAYDEVNNHINNHSQGLAHVAQIARRNLLKEWGFVVIGVALGAVVTNWKAIIEFFQTIIK